ncbi:hypothetical protein [Variovorax sp. TBS-050B]|uniref:hypothetical protein n=1 Tax=Variovorax sp. TBS-050B TaxID=2940551 RepID=UPI00247555F5|nr:hypothetical protein [Variovorax sp. TBS-050B]
MKSVLVAATLFASVAHAQTAIGPWYVSDMNDGAGSFVGTINDSGGMFGKYCYVNSQSCVWMMTADVGCEAGSEYPVLLNSDSGAALVTVSCKPIDGKNRYFFNSYTDVDDAVARSSRIGFAFPMESGQFRVTRFDIRQSTAAMKALETRMRKRPERPGRPATRDTTL